MQASFLARRWAKIVGWCTLGIGLVATFYLSAAVAETRGGEAAKSEGVTIAAAMLVITVLLAITAGRTAHELATALGIPADERRPPLVRALVALGTSVGAFALSLATIFTGYGLIGAAMIEKYGLTEAEIYVGEHSYYRDKIPTLGYAELAVSVALAAAAAWLMSRAGRGSTADPKLDTALYPRRALAVGGGFGILFATAIAFPRFFAADTLDETAIFLGLGVGILLGGVAMLALRPKEAAAAEQALLRQEANEDAGVKDAMNEIRRGTRRQWMVRIVSATAGILVTYGSIQVVNAIYAELPRRDQPGLFAFFGLVALGVATALFVSKRLDRRPVQEVDQLPSTGGIFNETLETTGELVVRQRHTLLGLLFGETAGQQFEIVDGGGAWCGSATEESSLSARLFLGWRRPLSIVVDDLGESAYACLDRWCFFASARPSMWERNSSAKSPGGGRRSDLCTESTTLPVMRRAHS